MATERCAGNVNSLVTSRTHYDRIPRNKPILRTLHTRCNCITHKLISMRSTYFAVTQFTCTTRRCFNFIYLITNTTSSETHNDEVIIITSCIRVNNPHLEMGQKKKLINKNYSIIILTNIKNSTFQCLMLGNFVFTD
jgi:hypothetical protein